MKKKINSTKRGFRYYEFLDRYCYKCSIQESSSAEPQLWIGPDSGQIFSSAGESYTRMLITKPIAWKLIYFLIWFVLTGEMPEFYFERK